MRWRRWWQGCRAPYSEHFEGIAAEPPEGPGDAPCRRGHSGGGRVREAAVQNPLENFVAAKKYLFGCFPSLGRKK